MPTGVATCVHRIKAMTRKEAKRAGEYMNRPLLSLERLSLHEKRGEVGCGLTIYLKLTFIAERRPPPQVAIRVLLMTARSSAE